MTFTTSVTAASSLFCVAHRGGPLINEARLPDNSVAALARALALPVPAIEIDVFQVEGELFVTHDRRLGHVVSGEGVITEQSRAYLAKQTLSNGEPLPTLRDVLALVGDKALLNIEIKGPNTAPVLAQHLQAFMSEAGTTPDQYIISSFDHHQLFACKTLLPEVRRGVLIEGLPLDYAGCCDALGAFSLNSHLSFLSTELIADARKRGLQNWVYTVNVASDWHMLSAMGVDAVFTDRPDALLAFNAACA